MIDEKSIVVVYLVNPREKYWGRVEALTMVGVHLRGMDLHMVEEWARELGRGDAPTMGPSSVFFPLSRIEKIFLDESVGAVRSVRQSFTAVTGRDAGEFL